MAFTPHYYTQFSGTIGDKEVWSCGFRLRSAGSSEISSAILDEHIQANAGLVQERFEDDNGRIPGVVKLTSWKLNAITATGHYRDPVTHEHHWDPGISVDVPPTLPQFVCCSVSLLTGLKRVRAHRGHIYWPNFGINLDGYSPPSATDAERLRVANWTRDLFRDVCNVYVGGATMPNERFVPIVASKIDGSVHDVTEIAVGNILDYVSSRKNAYSDVYRTIPYEP